MFSSCVSVAGAGRCWPLDPCSAVVSLVAAGCLILIIILLLQVLLVAGCRIHMFCRCVPCCCWMPDPSSAVELLVVVHVVVAAGVAVPPLRSAHTVNVVAVVKEEQIQEGDLRVLLHSYSLAEGGAKQEQEDREGDGGQSPARQTRGAGECVDLDLLWGLICLVFLNWALTSTTFDRDTFPCLGTLLIQMSDIPTLSSV